MVELSSPNPVNPENIYDNLSKIVDISYNVNDNFNTRKRDPKLEQIHLKLVSNWCEINDAVDRLVDNKINKVFLGHCIKYLPKTIEEFRTIQKFFSKKNYEFFGLIKE